MVGCLGESCSPIIDLVAKLFTFFEPLPSWEPHPSQETVVQGVLPCRVALMPGMLSLPSLKLMPHHLGS